MPPKPKVTNAMRMLDSRGIGYEALYFDADIHSATGVAEALGLPPERVFKTLVVMPDTPVRGRPLLAIVPGDAELDLKALAQAAGEKRVRMATQREAEQLTGLQVGGISALALLHKGFRVLLDASAQQFDQIAVSAGQRGLNVELPVAALIALTGAQLATLTA